MGGKALWACNGAPADKNSWLSVGLPDTALSNVAYFNASAKKNAVECNETCFFFCNGVKNWRSELFGRGRSCFSALQGVLKRPEVITMDVLRPLAEPKVTATGGANCVKHRHDPSPMITRRPKGGGWARPWARVSRRPARARPGGERQWRRAGVGGRATEGSRSPDTRPARHRRGRAGTRGQGGGHPVYRTPRNGHHGKRKINKK